MDFLKEEPPAPTSDAYMDQVGLTSTPSPYNSIFCTAKNFLMVQSVEL